MESTLTGVAHDQSSSRLCTVPGDIRNQIYELWALDASGVRILPSNDQADVGLLRTCRTVYHEASFFYHSANTFYFTDLSHPLHFLASRSQSNREHIKSIKFRYHHSQQAYDVLDLLASCTGLKMLEIEIGTLDHLDLDSPGVWPLRNIRGLRRLKIFGVEVCRDQGMSRSSPKGDEVEEKVIIPCEAMF
ncbi:MAG: hypothetical protein M1812_007870 [Candelaria pacifica]|nr:MAG: hypothetical protein M1812_007870 [Candelaria pacifica]